MSIIIKPQPGPQTEFLRSQADFTIYGGAAGGGKTFGLLLKPLMYVDVPGFDAVIFRRTSKQFAGAGSMWDESESLYRHLGGAARSHPRYEWEFPSGSKVQFSHLEHEKNKHDHQGKAYALIEWDELDQFSQSQVFYLWSRNRSTCGIRPHMVGTVNPDPDSWVRPMIDWWIGEDGYPITERSGVLRWMGRDKDLIVWGSSPKELTDQYGEDIAPKSITFIPAKLQDNAILMSKDPNYESTLKALPFAERERLLGGNWNIRSTQGIIFKDEGVNYWEGDARANRWMRQGRYVQSWDCSFGSKTAMASKVCGQLWVEYNGDHFLVDQVCQVMSFTETCKNVLMMTEKWPKTSKVLVEAKANGKAVFETFRKSTADKVNTANYRVIPALEYLADLNRRIRES